MENQYLKTHQLNVKTLSQNLKVLYNQEKLTLKNGRNGHKWHWYGIDIWINEETGTKINDKLESIHSFSDIVDMIAEALYFGPAVQIITILTRLLIGSWEITWTETDEGNGIHLSIELLTGTPYIVYVHAQ